MPTRKTRPQRRPRRRVTLQRAAGTAPAAAQLRRYALAASPPGFQVTLRIVATAEGRLLNGAFRKRNYATNVLSFRYDRRHGDVVLCHPVIRREAKTQRKSLTAHYAHLIVHGMLHLRGHDHLRKSDAARMERMEIRILRRLGFGDPYAEPAAVK